jgi:hypothetical protein
VEGAFLAGAIAGVSSYGDWFFRVEIEAGDVHGGRGGHGQRDEILDLLQVPFLLAEELFDGAHFVVGAAGETRDEIGYEVLLFAGFGAGLLEFAQEGDEIARGFAHAPEDLWMQVFGGDLEMAGDVILDQLTKVLGGPQRDIHADAGLDEDMPDARGLAGAAQQFEAALFVDMKVRTDGWPEAAGPMTVFAGVDVAVFAAVEVGGGPPRSEIVPWKVPASVSRRISLRTERTLRLERNLPW